MIASRLDRPDGHAGGTGKNLTGAGVLRSFSLFLVLLALWLLLSGFFKPLLIGLGVFSCAFVAWIARRMDLTDHEGHPIHLSWRALLYWPWLAWEIVKSSIDVSRIIVDPKLPISPRVIKVKASQADELGHVIYANSITLTPGTVSIDVIGHTITVHALTESTAKALETGDMDRRVVRMEGIS